MVHLQSIHPADRGKLLESRPDEVVWRFEYADEAYAMEAEAEGEEYEEVHLEPQQRMTQGTTRSRVALVPIDAHKGLEFERSQYISTTRNPELWFNGRRYRYKIIPALNVDEGSRTGVYPTEEDDNAPHEKEISFTNRIEPQAFVEVYDRLMDRTGSINRATSQIVWRNGGRFDWALSSLTMSQAQRVAAIVNSVITAPSARHGLVDWRREVYGALVFYAKNREDHRKEQEGIATQAVPAGDMFASLSDSTLAGLAKCIDVKNEIISNVQFLHALSTLPPELVGSCVSNEAFLDAAVKDRRVLFNAAELPEGGPRDAYIQSFHPLYASTSGMMLFSSVPLPFNVAAASHPISLGALRVAPNPQMDNLKATNPGAYELLKNTLAR